MFRLALTVGCAQLAAAARVTMDSKKLQTNADTSSGQPALMTTSQTADELDLSVSENSTDTKTYCPSISGYTVSAGKCEPGGVHIVNFADGTYAYYGQDRNGGIHSRNDAARRCSQHYDCAGFYTRENVGYSHYRSSITHVSSNPGHCCYQKANQRRETQCYNVMGQPSTTCYGDETCCGSSSAKYPTCVSAARGESCCTHGWGAATISRGQQCCGSGNHAASSAWGCDHSHHSWLEESAETVTVDKEDQMP